MTTADTFPAGQLDGIKKRLIDSPEVQEALRAWNAYDTAMRERYFTAGQRESLMRNRPKNPLAMCFFMDGYLQGKRAAQAEGRNS